jgi:hypothetical protein
MSRFFKANIYYICIYIYIFCFVSGDDANNGKIILSCEDNQWRITFNQAYEFGKNLYSLIESIGPITIELKIYAQNGYYIAKNGNLDSLNMNITENIPDGVGDINSGDIIIHEDSGDWFIDFIGTQCQGDSTLKVGEFESSSLDSFKNFMTSKNDGDKFNFTLSVERHEQSESEQPESEQSESEQSESEQSLSKLIIVSLIVVGSITLPLLLICII